MRTAVVDIGTNSTRLLVADVQDGRVTDELDKRSTVTRLGEGVDATGRLGDEPMGRVFRALDEYAEAMRDLEVEARTAVLTSAVRDAANGADFTNEVAERYGLEARTIGGDEEAELTFAGATSERPRDGRRVVVIDIGGGSTECVAGCDGHVDFHTSLQAGVVRMSERHLHDDPPTAEQVDALRAEVREIIDAGVPEDVRSEVDLGIAVAGTATSSASIDLELDPYDPGRTHGHTLDGPALVALLERLAAIPERERRRVTGLHPDRAPTIVAGVAMLLECLGAFGLDRVEVSEHDILRGAALQRANA